MKVVSQRTLGHSHRDFTVLGPLCPQPGNDRVASKCPVLSSYSYDSLNRLTQSTKLFGARAVPHRPAPSAGNKVAAAVTPSACVRHALGATSRRLDPFWTEARTSRRLMPRHLGELQRLSQTGVRRLSFPCGRWWGAHPCANFGSPSRRSQRRGAEQGSPPTHAAQVWPSRRAP